MFIHNKTLDWLLGKSVKDKTSLLINARQNVQKSKKLFQERSLEIERHFARKNPKKQEDEEKSSVKKLEEYTNNILTWGLWKTGEQVDFYLNTVIKSQKDKIEALKSQLNFRRFVLQQKISGDGFKTIYNVTKMEGRERVNLKPEELAEYVKKSSLIMRLLFQMTEILRRMKTIY